VLRHLSRSRLPKWTLPAAIGAGMLIFSIWNEYTWWHRTAGALPEAVVILSSPSDRVFYRPWTYVFPVSTRFMALDRTVLKTSAQNSVFRTADVLVVQRWTPTTRIPLAFDCAQGRHADLIEGAVLAPDGTLTGSEWYTVGMEDELQRAACQGE
ncbi:MAG: hypothetical protein U1D06_15410, partial [Paracoccaceae bacterium]|nr:hypothetical protein [Paracoccaceae bacterium]